MPSKSSPSAIRLNWSRANGAEDERSRAGATPVVWQELPAGEDLDGIDVRDAALIGDVEAAQPFDFVAVAVDADAGVARRREDVDDPAAHRDLSAVFDLVFPAIASQNERRDELVGIDGALGVDDDRRGLLRLGGKPLHECFHRGNEQRRARGRRGPGDAPERFEAPSHRLHRRGDPLERQRLPRREVAEMLLVEEALQIVEETLGLSGRRCRDNDHRRRRERRHTREHIGASRVGDGDRRVLGREQRRKRRLGGERRQERREWRASHEVFTLSIAAAIPRSKISSAASAASSIAE